MHSIHCGITVFPYKALERRPAQESSVGCVEQHNMKHSRHWMFFLCVCLYEDLVCYSLHSNRAPGLSRTSCTVVKIFNSLFWYLDPLFHGYTKPFNLTALYIFLIMMYLSHCFQIMSLPGLFIFTATTCLWLFLVISSVYVLTNFSLSHPSDTVDPEFGKNEYDSANSHISTWL
jgi:hypothetical protein